VRDVITHHYGSGFPKSLNVSKAIDAAAGAKREVVGPDPNHRERAHTPEVYSGGQKRPEFLTAPATDAAKQWDGWGTALKPASEHWILVRKPLAGTVAANVQEHGTGALNIDACRIEAGVRDSGPSVRVAGDRSREEYRTGTSDGPHGDTAQGRWPANLVLSHSEWCEPGACLPGCPVALLDAQSGVLTSGVGAIKRASSKGTRGNDYGAESRPAGTAMVCYGDTGGASRFFYISKPTTAEREENVRDLPRRSAGELVDRDDGSAAMGSPRTGAGRTSRGRANIHPTVKSVSLMSWLITLVTPPGGLVLDPFAGSGTTGVAAIRLDHRFLGFEIDPDYYRVALAKLERARRGDQTELCV
jgi:hypothetical protein